MVASRQVFPSAVVNSRPVAPDVTEATVRYTYTGLSETGNALVASRTEEYYLGFMQNWEDALNRYLTATA